jgi:hypothetical protein
MLNDIAQGYQISMTGSQAKNQPYSRPLPHRSSAGT